ncbi:MAG: hypothetical protein JOZ15_02830, partial [Acidobacteria bacterium]|nr:hypothetical protein [Acidobacteriota bacterium]
LPESLAVVHWIGARPEIPAGYYALTRSGSDLAVSLIAAGGGARGRGSSGDSAGSGSVASAGGGARSTAVPPAAAGPAPALLVAVGPDWRGTGPLGGSSAETAGGAGAGGAAGAMTVAQPARPPAALALFETGGSRLSSLGDLPGLAVFNAGPPGAARWRLPSEGIFRLLERLPAAEAAGWTIVALDPGSLRQAEALAPRLAALVPPTPAGAVGAASAHGGAGAAAAASPGIAQVPAGGTALSMGLWLEPRSALRIVSRIRQFVERFPLASRRQVELWRDWETVLDPLANCEHAALTATASPASMRLLLQHCTSSVPH